MSFIEIRNIQQAVHPRLILSILLKMRLLFYLMSFITHKYDHMHLFKF